MDIAKIRSKAKLQEIQQDLEYFLREPIIKEIYLEDYKWSEEDYLADIEEVTEALEKVKRRIDQLSQPIEKPGSRCRVREKVKTPEEAPPVELHDCDPCISPDSGQQTSFLPL